MAEEKKPDIVNKKQPVSSGFSVPERLWDFLAKEKGIGSIATAAIMGNIFQESTYNPSAINSSSGAKGLCQWYRGRADALDQVASSKGKSWTDVDVQLTHLWNEIGPSGYYNQFLNHMIKNFTTEDRLSEAVIYWEEHFEVSGDTASYPRRISAAIEALKKQGKGIVSGGNYTPGNSPGAGFMGQASPAKRGTIVENPYTEYQGHVDEYLVKPQDPDKTFCEPIYPDLSTVGDNVPDYAIPSDIPINEMNMVSYDKAGAGMVVEIPTTAMIEYSSNTDLLQFTYKNEAVANQRKAIFSQNKNRKAVKVPTAGKPPNNKDPFPVDAKISELESHQPRCKIDALEACKHSLEVAKATVLLSTDTEKRLVKLENNMATLMRYLYRMAGRININCVYYGGQTQTGYQKYNCIRCLKDDRIQEGKEVSLDQCLNCTRFEPFIGQVYDIFNDTGDNLSSILDDNQMSYTTMDEYYKFRNIDERQQPLENAKLDASNVKTRNTTEVDLDDEWGPGIAMDWALYPVEMQQPHIAGEFQPLASSYGGANGGIALTNGGAAANMLIEARNQIDSTASKAKDAGAEYAKITTDSVVSEMKASLGAKIRDTLKSKNASTQDSCLIASLMSVYGGQVESVIEKFESVKSSFKTKGVDNIVLHTMFYSLEDKYLFGDGDDTTYPKRLDKVAKAKPANEDPTENPGSNQNTSSTTNTSNDKWASVNTWNWNDISEPLAMNIAKTDSVKSIPDQMINFAKVVYLYKELLSKCSASRFDTAEWGFPFTEEQITGNLMLNFSSPFGPRNIPESHNTYHYGVDFGVGAGANAGDPGSIKGAEVHAARDGVVYDIATFADNDYGGQQVYLQHDGGYTSWYMHLSGFAVKKGDKVTRGQVIGYTGGSGPNNNQAYYAEHLHFEIHQGGDAKGNRLDPLKFYTGISNANKGSQLSSL